jgi:MarR family transcriptional regulator for hemolysin
MRLVGLGRRWRHALDTQLAAEGLSDAAWAPLVHLQRLGDGLSQSELAAATGIDGSSLVRLLDILVRQGLVERHADAADRRVKRIALTPAGRQRVQALHRQLAAIEDVLLGDLDDDAIAALQHAFERIEQRIAALAAPGR